MDSVGREGKVSSGTPGQKEIAGEDRQFLIGENRERADQFLAKEG
jgi:hypothetical protein